MTCTGKSIKLIVSLKISGGGLLNILFIYEFGCACSLVSFYSKYVGKESYYLQT